MEAVCFDYQKNLPFKYLHTRCVLFRTAFFLLVQHPSSIVGQGTCFYCYDKRVGKKGSDDVCSMLFDCFSKHFTRDVKHLNLFCDSCAGQNKNWTGLRFMHYLVHMAKRFRTITMTFPIRGHLYTWLNAFAPSP